MPINLCFKEKNKIIYSFLLYIFLIIFGSGDVFADNINNNNRSDIIIIKAPTEKTAPKMPSVFFLHDLHTEKLKIKNDCAVCHNKKDNKFIFGLKKTTDNSTNMDLYHNNCIGCHDKISGKKRGPINGECRLCHNKKINFASSQPTLSFYDTLHDIHENSPLIKAPETYDDNCAACHHSYDNTLNKTLYIEGEEYSCSECHNKKETSDKNSLAFVSHTACINCHLDLSKAKTAPITCKKCHKNTE